MPLRGSPLRTVQRARTSLQQGQTPHQGAVEEPGKVQMQFTEHKLIFPGLGHPCFLSGCYRKSERVGAGAAVPGLSGIHQKALKSDVRESPGEDQRRNRMKATTPALPARERFCPDAPLKDSEESPHSSEKLHGVEAPVDSTDVEAGLEIMLTAEGNMKGADSLDDVTEPVSFFEKPLPGEVVPETKQMTPEASVDPKQVRSFQSAILCCR